MARQPQLHDTAIVDRSIRAASDIAADLENVS
jgi:hypothetical protein